MSYENCNGRVKSLVAVIVLGTTAAGVSADPVDHRIPLNYNFHGLVHPTDWSPAGSPRVPANADRPASFRSMDGQRGLIWDPSSPHSIAYYSGVNAGPRYARMFGPTYAFFDSLGYGATVLGYTVPGGNAPDQAALDGLDMVMVGNRCSTLGVPDGNPGYESDPDSVSMTGTPVGIPPRWNVCNQTGLQTTVLASPILVDERTEIGLLYSMAFDVTSSSTRTFNVVLGFSDHDPVEVEVVSNKWRGNQSIPNRYNWPVRTDMAAHFDAAGGGFILWQGAGGVPMTPPDFDADAPVYTNLVGLPNDANFAHQNLNIMQSIIYFRAISSGVFDYPMFSNPNLPSFQNLDDIIGTHLTSISFEQVSLDAATGILAVTVRTGTPQANSSCAAAQPISLGTTTGDTWLAPFDGRLSSCSAFPPEDTHGLWYVYTPSVGGSVTADTCTTSVGFMDTVIAVYTTASTCADTAVGCNDNFCGRFSSVTWMAAAGTPYLIRVSANFANTGQFALRLTQASSGVCCRGATCSAAVTQAYCTASGAAGALFVNAAPACNAPGNLASPCCHADYNKVGGVTVQDIFDFLSGYFTASPFARVGGDGAGAAPTVQSIFDFLAGYFTGC